jgi:hypothetical protein
MNTSSFFNFHQIAANYYGIALANLVGFKLGDVNKYVSWILAAQDKSGGFFQGKRAQDCLFSFVHWVPSFFFFIDTSLSVTSLEATYYAVRSLSLIGGVDVVGRANQDALVSYLRDNAGEDLRSAFFAHASVALTSKFADSEFDIIIAYEPLEGSARVVENRIVQVRVVMLSYRPRSQKYIHLCMFPCFFLFLFRDQKFVRLLLYALSMVSSMVVWLPKSTLPARRAVWCSLPNRNNTLPKTRTTAPTSSAPSRSPITSSPSLLAWETLSSPSTTTRRSAMASTWPLRHRSMAETSTRERQSVWELVSV